MKPREVNNLLKGAQLIPAKARKTGRKLVICLLLYGFEC